MTQDEMMHFCHATFDRSIDAGQSPVDLLSCLTTSLCMLIATNPDPRQRRDVADSVIEVLDRHFPAAPHATRH